MPFLFIITSCYNSIHDVSECIQQHMVYIVSLFLHTECII